MTISESFFLGIHPVTRGQFEQFARNTGFKTEAEVDRGARVWNGTSWTVQPVANWRNPGFEQTLEHPVVCVSWNDAQKFVEWLEEKEGREYRLPSEAEWEYACRAGTSTRFFTGDDPDSLAGFANVDDVTAHVQVEGEYAFHFEDGFVHTSPVGVFRPNPWGLFDMVGNAWEWCEDCYQAKTYQRGDCEDPTGPKSGLLKNLLAWAQRYDAGKSYEQGCKVCRGGAWNSVPRYCRSAQRGYYHESNCQNTLGFRIVMAPSDT